MRSSPRAKPWKQEWLNEKDAIRRFQDISYEEDAHGVTYYPHDYNLRLPIQLTRRELEFYCYMVGWDPRLGGLGRFEHFRRAQALTWPQLEWNPWLEWLISTICDDRFAVRKGGSTFRCISLAGCATSGKTFGAGFYTSMWFAANPTESIAILTSTTKDMIRRRVWPVVTDFASSAMDVERGEMFRLGHLVPSRTVLQAKEGDDKHSIFAQAVAAGETAKAIENIKGQHAPRILLVIDEATGTPEAVPAVIPNLRKSCADFTVLVIGNPVSHMDPHGRLCEPLHGWDSITIDSERWVTKGVPEWQVDRGVCLHFDGLKSPNVTRGGTKWPYIYTFEDYEQGQRLKDENSVSYWSMDRGFWAPQGTLHTVLTPALITKYNAEGELYFRNEPTPVAGLDPAFGGDGCILRFGLMGVLSSGSMGIQLTDMLDIELSAISLDEADYQIARKVINECERRGVKPENCAVDSTGVGRGVAAILRQEWGDCHKVEFGGSPSDKPVSEDDKRSCNEVYDRRVTELWFDVRELVKRGGLGGMRREEVVQFCSREYGLRGRKYRLDTKEECRKKIGRSPDHADAVAVLVQLLAKDYGTSTSSGEWASYVLTSQDMYEPEREVW